MKFKKEIYKQQKKVKETHGLDFGKKEYGQIIKNFKLGDVWVPYTHSDDPRDNIGFVDSLFYKESTNSLWAEVDVIEEEAIKRIKKGLVKDVSVSVYEDDEKGWVLEHVALTMNPAVKGQEPFSQLNKKLISIQCENLKPFCEVNNMTEVKEDEAQEVLTEELEVEVSDEPEGSEEVEAENPTVEADDVEEAENFFQKVVGYFTVQKDEMVKSLALDNEGLKSELEASKETISELTEVINTAKEAVSLLEEDKRVREWNLIFDKNLGIKVTPKEKELLFERINDPEELRTELDARTELGLMEKKTVELENKAVDDVISNLPEDERAMIEKFGWDKEENNKYLEIYLKNRDKETD